MITLGITLIATLASVVPQQVERGADDGFENLIVATTGPVAIRAGMDAMLSGGTAADAALTTALAQIVLAAGSWVSFAGRMTVVYYDAETETLHSLNANYDVPREEKDPLTIPRQGTPSGRTVLVPGFMAGVEALHRRFGKKELADIFAPAIRLAEDGFVLDRGMARLMASKHSVLTRLEESRRIFMKESGEAYREGERFRQPVLAATLRNVAKQGAAYMYRGDWARHFVAAVRAEGGQITLDDLEQYEVRWETPLATTFREYRVHGLRPPNRGGPLALLALNFLGGGELRELGHYTQSVEALVQIVRAEQLPRVLFSPRLRQAVESHLSGVDLTEDYWSPEVALKLRRLMEGPEWKKIVAETRGEGPGKEEHSDAIVARDSAGNVLAMIHTINTGGWGTTGLFVDGVSIPDSAAFQQSAMQAVGPGGRLPDHGAPIIVTKEGRPVHACSATGSGNFTAVWQNLINVLEYGMSPQAAADQPNIYAASIQRGELANELVRGLSKVGLEVRVVERHRGSDQGYWVGLSIDPETGRAIGGKIRQLDGIALGR
ncbi:MAG: gamma-glutamyltransferase [Planctomycetota bacterium]